MRITLLGVRGSTPEPDPACAGYGGHTSCVAVAVDQGTPPTLVLDAGTGIRTLGRLLPDGVFRGRIVVSHMHWDHMHGLPFSGPLNQPGCEVALHLPVQDSPDARAELARAMSPPVFPIGPEGLIGRWTFEDVPGTAGIGVGPLTVRTVDVRHKGARTVAVRVDSTTTGRSFGYLPDHVPALGMTDAVADLLRDVDLLAHDAQYLPHESRLAHDYGHATTEEALAVAQRVGARSLLLTHHAPGRTDEQLDALAQEVAGNPLPTQVARQGATIDIAGSDQ